LVHPDVVSETCFRKECFTVRRIVVIIFMSLLLAVSGVQLMTGPTAIAPALAREENLAFSADRIEQVDEYLDRVAAIGFRGAVLVASGDEILLDEGYGAVDPSGEEKIGQDTIFAIGSNTKPFTAAAILKLQDEGKLSVEDSIDKYLPDVPADKSAITIHQLLTHSAGFDHSGIFEGDFEQVGQDEAVRRILASELLFPPGSESSYADPSMILLAAIVEHVSGQPYETYLHDELFAPAGMAHTGFRDADPALLGSAQAVGIVDGEPAGTPADLPPLSWSLMGAGGMVSTVEDLFRWHNAVKAGMILSPEGQSAYAAPHVSLDETSSEGYGWVIAEPVPGHRLRASAGGTDEIAHVNVIDWWLDDDLVVIASSADASYNAEDITAAIEKILFGLPQEMPPAMVDVDSSLLRDLAGRYELPEGGAIVVTATEDRLLISPEGAAGFATLFPPDGEDEEQTDPAATIAYLESGKEAGIDAWKTEQDAALGPFQRMTVMGSASAEGSGEAWTYVAFEFANGNVLTRWIVDEDGVLGAAVVPSEPPTVMLLPISPKLFASFSLGRPNGFEAVFANEESGASTLRLTPNDGDDVMATRKSS
jgi:CubicO group peptidase (beta-lactamase class C family)